MQLSTFIIFLKKIFPKMVEDLLLTMTESDRTEAQVKFME